MVCEKIFNFQCDNCHKNYKSKTLPHWNKILTDELKHTTIHKFEMNLFSRTINLQKHAELTNTLCFVMNYVKKISDCFTQFFS